MSYNLRRDQPVREGRENIDVRSFARTTESNPLQPYAPIAAQTAAKFGPVASPGSQISTVSLLALARGRASRALYTGYFGEGVTTDA